MVIVMDATFSYEYCFLSMELIYAFMNVEENTKKKITFWYYLIYTGKLLFSTLDIHWTP